jgi:hypothetical protein
LIFDRISHEVPFYRSYLKHAALNGTVVVNNPFWWSADEKFFGYSLAARLGLTVPKTVLLPQKSYKPGVTELSLRNLEFPLDWDGVIEYVGLPAILKPHDGGGWKDVYRVASKEELWQCYDRTGSLVMILQELIDFSSYYRCYCVGRKEVLVIPYDPADRRYLSREGQSIDPQLEDRMVRDSILINEALGYDLNSVEFAVKDGVAYAVDFTNPAPDAENWSVTEPYFNWIAGRVAEMLVDYAKHAAPTARYHRWNKWLNQEAAAELPGLAAEPPRPRAAAARKKAPQASKVPSKATSKVASKAAPTIAPPPEPGPARKATVKQAAGASAARTARTSKAARSVKKK